MNVNQMASVLLNSLFLFLLLVSGSSVAFGLLPSVADTTKSEGFKYDSTRIANTLKHKLETRYFTFYYLGFKLLTQRVC